MSPVNQLQHSIDQLRQYGDNILADQLQNQLDCHNSQADLAEIVLKVRQAFNRRAMGF